MDSDKLPYKIQGAIWKTPKAVYKPRREDYLNKPKPFGNPREPGYGGGEWPFDRAKAYADVRYRTGIRKAIGSNWADGHWIHEAQRALVAILDDLLAAELIHEELTASGM